MSRPTRQTAGGQAYLDLQNRARREGRTTQELLILYVLERWLARLATSPSVDTFVLKGGMLLATLDARRPTADADLLARYLAHDAHTVAARVRDIAQVTLSEDDGVDYLTHHQALALTCTIGASADALVRNATGVGSPSWPGAAMGTLLALVEEHRDGTQCAASAADAVHCGTLEGGAKRRTLLTQWSSGAKTGTEVGAGRTPHLNILHVARGARER